MMKNKIVVLHPYYWEQSMGGAELQIKYLIEYLIEKEYEVHYIFESDGTEIKHSNRINLYPLRKIKIRGLGENHILNTFKVLKLLNKIKPDAIYTRMYSSWSGLATRYAKKKFVKHIWAIASNSDVERKIDIKLIIKPLNLLSFILVHNSFVNATHIITQNDYQHSKIKNQFNRKTFKITQLGKPEENLYKKDNSIIKIVWIGNFKSLKQPELFRELAKHINSSTRYEMVMVGDFQESYNIQDWNKPEIKLNYIGKKSINEVNEILNKAHILINTSKFEGFSNTFIQAWFRKVPVVSMNTNPDNILTSQNIGFVCPTLEELIEKTNLLVNNNELRKKMGEKAYDYANENHSIKKIMPLIFELIK